MCSTSLSRQLFLNIFFSGRADGETLRGQDRIARQHRKGPRVRRVFRATFQADACPRRSAVGVLRDIREEKTRLSSFTMRSTSRSRQCSCRLPPHVHRARVQVRTHVWARACAYLSSHSCLSISYCRSARACSNNKKTSKAGAATPPPSPTLSPKGTHLSRVHFFSSISREHADGGMPMTSIRRCPRPRRTRGPFRCRPPTSIEPLGVRRRRAPKSC